MNFNDTWMIKETSIGSIPKLMDKIENRLSTINMSSVDFWFPSDDARSQLRPYEVNDGTLMIPVKGALMGGDFPWQIGEWATGYTYISEALQRGLSDDSVNQIALMVDSPGGHVKGCFELVDEIYNYRNVKPIQAFVADSAYSAGYAIASACSKVNVTRTGGTGSVGVITCHYDISEMNKADGIKVTYIYKGEHKADGNCNTPLSDEVEQKILASLEPAYELFTNTVARNRNIKVEDVINTQAQCYTANDSISIGFADSIGDTKLQLLDYNNNSIPENNTLDEDLEDKIMTENEIKEIKLEASKMERERISAILGCDESKGKQTFARFVAFETSMGIDEAKRMIVASGKEEVSEKIEAPAPVAEKVVENKAFSEVMNKIGGTGIVADSSAEREPSADKEVKKISKDDLLQLFSKK